MPGDQTTLYEVERFGTVTAFLDEIARRPHIHMIKVDDQGLYGSTVRGSTRVMQPMVRVVATAFDHVTNTILRWERTQDVGSDVVRADAANGGQSDPTGTRTRDAIIQLAEMRGLVVSRGEWTAKSILRTLANLNGETRV